MAEMKVVKKVMKLGGRGAAGGKNEDTGLRPYYVEKIPPCTFMCPSAEDIRGYLTYIAQAEKYGRSASESFTEGWHIITNRNPFPAIDGPDLPAPLRGRLQPRQARRRRLRSTTWSAGSATGASSTSCARRSSSTRSGPEKVAVVGGGPAGLSCAYQLARRGYAVTVFEGAAKGGGMLRYGIPSYRLPDDVLDAEIQAILDLGVELRLGVQVGRDVAMEDLRRDYQAVYLAIGAQKGVNLGLKGEDAPNCFSGVDFLQRVRVGEKIDVGDKVIVIGGGNTAIDAARTSRRLGAHVTLLYRRTRKEMPAIEHEITEAEHEGVAYEFLSAPLEIVVKDGRAVAVKCQRMELGEPDASGRRRPVAVAGSEYEVPCTAVIAGISQIPVWTGIEEFRGEKGWIDVNEVHETSVPGVFAGGDVTVGLGHRDPGDRPRPPGGGGHRPQVPATSARPSPTRARSSAPTRSSACSSTRRSRARSAARSRWPSASWTSASATRPTRSPRRSPRASAASPAACAATATTASCTARPRRSSGSTRACRSGSTTRRSSTSASAARSARKRASAATSTFGR